MENEGKVSVFKQAYTDMKTDYVSYGLGVVVVSLLSGALAGGLSWLFCIGMVLGIFVSIVGVKTYAKMGEGVKFFDLFFSEFGEDFSGDLFRSLKLSLFSFGVVIFAFVMLFGNMLSGMMSMGNIADNDPTMALGMFAALVSPAFIGSGLVMCVLLVWSELVALVYSMPERLTFKESIKLGSKVFVSEWKVVLGTLLIPSAVTFVTILIAGASAFSIPVLALIVFIGSGLFSWLWVMPYIYRVKFLAVRPYVEQPKPVEADVNL